VREDGGEERGEEGGRNGQIYREWSADQGGYRNTIEKMWNSKERGVAKKEKEASRRGKTEEIE